jgi:hypothetical protein
MNVDNFLGDKPSTRVRAPPGGRTSLDLFGGYEPAPAPVAAPVAAPARAPLAPAPVYASFDAPAAAPAAKPAAAPAARAAPAGVLCVLSPAP